MNQHVNGFVDIKIEKDWSGHLGRPGFKAGRWHRPKLTVIVKFTATAFCVLTESVPADALSKNQLPFRNCVPAEQMR